MCGAASADSSALFYSVQYSHTVSRAPQTPPRQADGSHLPCARPPSLARYAVRAARAHFAPKAPSSARARRRRAIGRWGRLPGTRLCLGCRPMAAGPRTRPGGQLQATQLQAAQLQVPQLEAPSASALRSPCMATTGGSDASLIGRGAGRTCTLNDIDRRSTLRCRVSPPPNM